MTDQTKDEETPVGRHVVAYRYASKRLRPPPFAFVRAGMRLSIGAVFYAFGYTHVFTVFAVMAAMSLINTVEVQVAKDIAKALNFPAIRKLLPRLPTFRKLGPEYRLSEALEVFNDNELNRIVTDLSYREDEGGPALTKDEERQYRSAFRRRRQQIRSKLSEGRLIAFGVMAGGEEVSEIPTSEVGRLTMRFTEDRLFDPDTTLDYTEVRVRENLSAKTIAKEDSTL